MPGFGQKSLKSLKNAITYYRTLEINRFLTKKGKSKTVYNSLDFYYEPLKKLRQTVPHNSQQGLGVMMEVIWIFF